MESPWGYLTRRGGYANRLVVPDAPVEGPDGVGFVELDADDGFLGAEAGLEDFGAPQEAVGVFDHDPVVVGEVGLALGAVDDEVLDADSLAQGVFDMGGQGGPAQADDS